jgi:hypothetical protein
MVAGYELQGSSQPRLESLVVDVALLPTKHSNPLY